MVHSFYIYRLDLSHMVMLKDNHIWSCNNDIAVAVSTARSACGFSSKIEVECRCLSEARIAAESGADVVMLDNYKPEAAVEEASVLKKEYPHLTVEVSGGITQDSLKQYLGEGVDIISCGSLTQGYQCLDYSLKICKERSK